MSDESSQERRISIRIPRGKFPGIRKRLANTAKLAGVNQSTCALAAIEALCAFAEQYGAVQFPVQIALKTLEKAIEGVSKEKK